MAAKRIILGTCKPITGRDIALEFLQCLGFRYALHQAYIVTYNLQDVDFSGYGLLSTLLLHQLALGADITVLTTPPEGKGTGKDFKRKLNLLTTYRNNGIKVFLNHNIHAKVYIFRDERKFETVIVGSANLTSHGFFQSDSSGSNLLEIALTTNNTILYDEVAKLIGSEFINDKVTMDLATWERINIDKVSIARGG
jgi:phosphatidylserine/phosphatidylglycerophosphate/cardiolipin synthase-like enzyme